VLVQHEAVLTAYADGQMHEQGEAGEAYLSHFTFGVAMRQHYAANRNRVAGYAGPCSCRWLVLDIDRANLDEALNEARRLVTRLAIRYPESEGQVPIYFSGGKGFHVLVELAHAPPPSVGFHLTARAFAESIAQEANVTIDTSIYDVAHIIRLPNTRHPRTGLYKRRLDAEVLFTLDVNGIRRHAAHPAGDGLPSAGTVPARLAHDWQAAELATGQQQTARAEARQDFTPDARAPKYLLDLLRFGVEEGERHTTVFRAAAWLAEQGAPPSLCSALLTEAGNDVGLMPQDVARQIRCGVEHARRQRTQPANAARTSEGGPT
jgi:hypothetical protein